MLPRDDTAEFLRIDGFKGNVFEFGRRGYATARQIYNMRERDLNPALILKARDEDDVAAAMRRAAQLKHPIGIRSGGHNLDSTAMAGPVVIDLSGFRQTHVDTKKRRIRVGAGILLGDLDALCQEHRMVVPTGTVGTTGVAGLTLGGGVGFKMRELGATVDNLLSCKVVTTQGNIVTASADENTDLFWGLRGAGANFGVVTELEFQAHPFNPTTNVGRMFFPTSQMVDVMVKLGAYMDEAPREIGLVAAMARPPRGDEGPPSRDPILMVIMVTTGDPTDFAKYVNTIASFGSPLVKETVQMPWVHANTMLEMGAPTGLRAHSRGGYASDPGEEFFGRLRERALAMPDPETMNSFVMPCAHITGAIADDFAEDSVAFSRENASFLLEIVGVWTQPEQDRESIEWVDKTVDSVRSMLLPNAYINLTCDNDLDWLRGVYGKPEKFQRLVALKRKWDPDNLLRFNRNIPPDAA